MREVSFRKVIGMQRGEWPDPQYPPVTCGGCGKEVPEQEACWGYCGDCWDNNQVPDLT